MVSMVGSAPRRLCAWGSFVPLCQWGDLSWEDLGLQKGESPDPPMVTTSAGEKDVAGE